MDAQGRSTTMTFELKGNPPYPYSPGEQEVFRLLVRKMKGRTTKELTELFYRDRKRPYNDRKSVVGFARSLQDKVERNKEPFRILSTPRSGPIPMTFWLEA